MMIKQIAYAVIDKTFELPVCKFKVEKGKFFGDVLAITNTEGKAVELMRFGTENEKEGRDRKNIKVVKCEIIINIL